MTYIEMLFSLRTADILMLNEEFSVNLVLLLQQFSKLANWQLEDSQEELTERL